MTDETAMILQLTVDFPLTEQEAREICIGVGWDYKKAVQTVKEIYGYQPENYAEADELPDVPDAKPVIDANSAEEEKFMSEEPNDKFEEKRKQAKNPPKWLLVYVSEKKVNVDPLKPEGLMRDHMNCRFVGFTTNLEEPDGRWFIKAYKISSVPVYAILDPVTAQLKESFTKELTTEQLSKYLRQFLFRDKTYGLPVDYIVDHIETDMSSDDDSDNGERIVISNSPSKTTSIDKLSVEKPTEPMLSKVDIKAPSDPGKSVLIKVRTPEGKMANIDIGENFTIEALYKKVSLILATGDSIVLYTTFPKQKLDDRTKTIKELKLNRQVLEVEIV